ncbi:MAG TPA: TonB-dependent receptor [Porticoccaceae bacterium]|nr:TonB-dependent receptor [Porticoccaceae bacterium]HCO59883.1 TonB-dependent receptor [Porticoccaceae bacterium]
MRQLLLFTVVTVTVALPFHSGWAKEEQIVEEVTVIGAGLRERLYKAGMLKDVIQKTEVISDTSIEQMNAVNLTEAISESPGVRVSNECSMCGVKRVMLNGMRGEHTTILVDGIATYTMMSGFYGLDAAASAGINSIEIARGAGASLIAPEAIGGTINLVTKEATENSVEIDLSGGDNGYRKGSMVATGLANQDSTRITLIGQYDERDEYDGDNNRVSENPYMENRSFTAYLSQDLGFSDNLRLRINHTESEIFGGPDGSDIGKVLASFAADPSESPSLFVDDDVRNDYIGRPWETAEWIESDRDEIYLSWLHEFNADFNLQVSVSHNEHSQNSFYEGFSYEADNDMSFVDVRMNWALNSDHLLTFGADGRFEELRSKTNSDSPDYVSDSFDYDTNGVYIQDTWTPSENLEVALAVRFDQIEADFIDPSKPGTEIDDNIISPRLDMRYTHTDQWTSRFSYGRGYRAPLSFFESDHGILDAGDGFAIEIDEVERSESFNYALSFADERLSATASLAYTEVENLAALDETDSGVPLLTQMDKDADVLVTDIALTYHLLENLSLTMTAERIDYSDEFKQAFGVVPVEERLVLSVDWHIEGWDVYTSATWIGSRDLSEYGTPETPTFDAAGTEPMSQSAESYWTVDLRGSRHLGDNWEIYVGASNLFDYTQVEDMESPLFFEDGGYDVAYIYGPLRGREAYAGVKYSF